MMNPYWMVLVSLLLVACTSEDNPPTKADSGIADVGMENDATPRDDGGSVESDIGVPRDLGLDASGVDTGTADATMPAFTLELLDSPLRVRRGSASGFRVRIERSGGFQGAVTVSATGFPTASGPDPLEIPAFASEGSLNINALPTSVPGGPWPIAIHAEGVDDPGVSADAETTLYIAGLPGTADASFGTGGVVTHDVMPDRSETVYGGFLTAEGGVAFGGVGQTLEPALGYVARTDRDGALDPGFADSGRFLDFPDQTEVWSVAQRGSKIVLAALTSDGVTTSAFLRGLEADGRVDAAFGTGGDVVLPGPASRSRLTRREDTYLWDTYQAIGLVDAAGVALPFTAPDPLPIPQIQRVAIDSMNRVVIGAYDFDGLRFARLQADGAIDPTFGSGGQVFVPESTDADFTRVEALLISPDDSIYVTSRVQPNGAGFIDSASFLSAFDVNGAPLNFGVGGSVLVEDPGFVQGLVGQADGRVLLWAEDASTFDGNRIVRFLPDGGVDPSFPEIDHQKRPGVLLVEPGADRLWVLTGGDVVTIERFWL